MIVPVISHILILISFVFKGKCKESFYHLTMKTNHQMEATVSLKVNILICAVFLSSHKQTKMLPKCINCLLIPV